MDGGQARFWSEDRPWCSSGSPSFLFLALAFFFFFHSSGFGHCQINVDGQLHMEISSGIDLVSICVGKYFLELVSTLKNSVLIFSNDFRFEIHKKKTKLL